MGGSAERSRGGGKKNGSFSSGGSIPSEGEGHKGGVAPLKSE